VGPGRRNDHNDGSLRLSQVGESCLFSPDDGFRVVLRGVIKILGVLRGGAFWMFKALLGDRFMDGFNCSFLGSVETLRPKERKAVDWLLMA